MFFFTSSSSPTPVSGPIIELGSQLKINLRSTSACNVHGELYLEVNGHSWPRSARGTRNYGRTHWKEGFSNTPYYSENTNSQLNPPAVLHCQLPSVETIKSAWNDPKSSQVKSTWLDLKFKSGISDLTWLDLKIEKEGKDLILTWTWGDMGCTTQNQLGGGDMVYKGVTECIYDRKREKWRVKMQNIEMVKLLTLILYIFT